ncbi:MAG: 4-hydroxy-tetrahydrodipicolinate synthase [Chitinophagales bacterium]|nr:4-hydroxy-tetrahydrodipicolinate synthase [Chitinophagales bacterium]
MIQSKLRGTGVALVTPFNSKAEIDFSGLGKVINHCIDGGVEYVVSLGTTGESVNLSKEEKLEVLNYTISEVKGRVPVVAGFGGNSTHEVLKDIEKFHFNGVDAILSVSPYYNKPTQDGIIAHYKAIAAAAPRPIILYNVPGRTGSNMKAETTLRLANESENIIGMKEASGDFGQCMQIAKHKPKDFLLISGDDNITLGLIAYGMDGVISVVGQAFPKIFTEMVRQSLKGNFDKARELHYKLNDITDMLFAEGNPGGVKYALEVLGICESHLRLPLYPISEALKAKMRKAIGELR